MSDKETRDFARTVVDNLKRNGFPDKKVAFSLERMYETAFEKGLNFNKVLAVLEEAQIAHEKTPEKIIFFPKPTAPQAPPVGAAAGFAGLADLLPQMMKGLDTSGMDPSKMDMATMMSLASQMMQNMSPEQLASLKGMYENMSDEERAALMENAKKMGLV